MGRLLTFMIVKEAKDAETEREVNFKERLLVHDREMYGALYEKELTEQRRREMELPRTMSYDSQQPFLQTQEPEFEEYIPESEEEWKDVLADLQRAGVID